MSRRLNRQFSTKATAFSVIFVSLCLIVLSGCNQSEPNFLPNKLMQHRMERELRIDLQPIANQVQNALHDAFGFPNHSRWPETLKGHKRYEQLVDDAALQRASGPVGRSFDHQLETGLFRKHCANCHGITGDGLGPTAALLNPYPRDFRRGSFKFKDSAYGSRPSLNDLETTIEKGIPGTSMPALANLKRSEHYSDDIPVLAQYVRFLAIRGEVERELMMNTIRDLEPNEVLYDSSLKKSDPQAFDSSQKRIDEVIQRVADRWIQDALPSLNQSASASISTLNDLVDHRASIERGRELFAGSTAACAQCHGKDGAGDPKWKDYDEWTKDWTIRAGIDPTNKKEWSPLKQLGLLKPVVASPRNLTLGVYHGHTQIDSPRSIILRAIVNGLEGSPMPPAARVVDTQGGLTEAQITDLVNFVESLGTMFGAGGDETTSSTSMGMGRTGGDNVVTDKAQQTTMNGL